jgi:cytochrome c oxidase cbb3-type subunit I/II
MDPRSTSPGSNMPAYTWLEGTKLDVHLAPRKLALMQKLNVPYTNADIDNAEASQQAQAQVISADLATQGVQIEWDREMVALIAYLQRLGREKGVPFEIPQRPTAALNEGSR